MSLSKTRRLRGRDRRGRSSIDRFLVAEQAGLRWMMIGLFLSLGFGFFIQWLTDPAKIRPLLEQELAKNHFTFESVRFRLSSGIFPEFAFYVTNLEGTFSVRCENDTWLRMDEVRVPIGPSVFFQKEFRPNRFEVGDVHVERKAVNGCSPDHAAPEEPKAHQNTAAIHPANESTGVVPPTSPPQTLPPLHLPLGRFVGSLNIQYLHYVDHRNEMVFDFYRLNAEASPTRMEAQGILNFTNESVVTSYTPQASFEMWADETNLHASLSGQWREGQFNAAAHANLSDQTLDAQIKIDHLPFSEFLPFFKKVGLLSHDYNFANTWLNLRAATKGKVSLQTLGPFQVAQAEVFGDVGSIAAHDVEFRSLMPLEYDPLRLKITALHLERFLRSLNVTTFPLFLGELGTSSGILSYTSPEKFRLDIEHSGLEFLFSNRGEREKQAVSQLNAHALFENGQWNASVDNVRLVDGLFGGDVNIRADAKTFRASVHAEELSLASSVQRLMTNDGTLGRWSGDLNLVLSPQGKLMNSQVDLRANDLIIERLAIKKVHVRGGSGSVGKVVSSSSESPTKLELRAQGLSLNASSPVYPAVAQVLGKDLEFDALDGSITADSNGVFGWELNSLRNDRRQISSSGHWNAAGAVNGSALVKESKPKTKWIWRLTGTRAAPEWSRQ